jgi:hypothetical protein
VLADETGLDVLALTSLTASLLFLGGKSMMSSSFRILVVFDLTVLLREMSDSSFLCDRRLVFQRQRRT